MKITPEIIENKEFKNSVLGYNKKEVDFFLDKVIEEFEILIKEKQKLREEKDILLNQLVHFKKIENQLNETLLKAQESADEIILKAEKDYASKLNELSFTDNNNNNLRNIDLEKKINKLKNKYYECKEIIENVLIENIEFLKNEFKVYNSMKENKK